MAEQTETQGRWVSPNEMLEAAREYMLDGQEVKTKNDWILVANFMAANMNKEVAEPAMQVMRMLYDMPLTEEEVADITAFQLERRA